MKQYSELDVREIFKDPVIIGEACWRMSIIGLLVYIAVKVSGL